jgi:hypothetical protein
LFAVCVKKKRRSWLEKLSAHGVEQAFRLAAKSKEKSLLAPQARA